MKSFVLLLLVVGFFVAGFADSDCKKKDIHKIQTCYKNVYGNDLSSESGPYLLAEPILSTNFTKKYWQPFCDKKQKLNDCIGTDVIKSCYNVPDIKKIPYHTDNFKDDAAKIVVASFIHVDYVCDKYFKLSDTDYNCYLGLDALVNTTCIDVTGTFCEFFNKAHKCYVDFSNNTCGNAVGCFVKKTGTLMECYVDNDYDCHACDDISSANNFIDGLCDDDNDSSSKNVDENVVDEISTLIDLLKIVT